jgi:hypothetical protein
VKWQYRVVYRLRQEFWSLPAHSEWTLYCANANPMGRPYTNVQAVNGIVFANNNSDPRYEYKGQKFPLTQEWEDI